MWIPRGFAHGFLVLSASADLFYKCDAPYRPGEEIVLRWNDPALGIQWGCDAPRLSARDGQGFTLAELEGRLPRYEVA
jgi:dTDP-4-dehydrorhamnose 3,5-epimerase